FDWTVEPFTGNTARKSDPPGLQSAQGAGGSDGKSLHIARDPRDDARPRSGGTGAWRITRCAGAIGPYGTISRGKRVRWSDLDRPGTHFPQQRRDLRGLYRSGVAERSGGTRETP